MDCSEILGYYRHAYEVVQEAFKFQNPDPKCPLGACKNPPIFCLLKFGGYDRYQYEVLQQGFKGSPGVHRGHAPPPPLHKRPIISETVQIPTPKPHIFLFLMIIHIQ